MGKPTENKEKKEKAPLPVRSCVVMALAGAYVMYTGYNLCHDVLKGEEGSSWGFMAAGVIFLILGGAFVVNGIRGWIRADKEKKDREALETKKAEDSQEADPEIPDGDPEENGEAAPAPKKMSIADRANLVSRLGDEEEKEE